jgi:predicted permease
MPDWTNDIRRRLDGVRLSVPDEANVTEELQQHLDDRYHEFRAKGVAEDDARRLALEELGENEFLKQRMRGAIKRTLEPVPIGARDGRGLMGVVGDFRFGARLLRRAPGFTLTAALTIALGIAANTTIFSILNALLLRPLPGTVRANQLVLIGRTQDGQGFDTFSYHDFLDYQRASKALSSIAAMFTAPAHMSTGGASERVRADVVSGNYFSTLGTQVAQGRLLIPDDDRAGNRVVVLSYGVWERRFGSDAGIVGKSIRLNGTPFTVIGVAEPGFNGARATGVVDLFVPLGAAEALLPSAAEMKSKRGAVWLDFFGRLAPGVTPVMAQAELDGIASELARRYPDSNKGLGVWVSPGIGFDPATRKAVATFISILTGVVALVLLIACANVSNLLLARGAARARELAVRASLGASRARLVRQLFAEGALLATLGGISGFVLGLWSLKLVMKLPVFAARFGGVEPSIDLRVLGFAAGTMVLSGLLFAIPPALRTSRVDLVTSLKLGTAGSGDGRSRLRTGLVVAQLALSLVLLVGAGLFVRTLQALYHIDSGFDTRAVMVATVDVGLQGYDDARGQRLLVDLEQRVQAIPGVEHAALGYMLPFGGGGWDTRIFASDVTPAPEDPGLKSDINAVSPGYFETLGIQIQKGRGFTDADRADGPPVAIINDAIAEKLWPGRDPIGKSFRNGRTGTQLVEVVGVVRTARYRSIVESPRPFYYRPMAQAFRPSMTLHVRTPTGDPLAVLPQVRRALDELDRDLPLSRVATLAMRLESSVGPQRTAAALVGAYGILALVLAVVGLYGSMAYSVSRRTREMGLRMALGARASEVRRHVLGQALRIALVGTGIGLVVAVPATRLVRSQLYGVQPTDPVTLGGVIVILAAAALLAAYAPARRATRVDPVVALRSE